MHIRKNRCFTYPVLAEFSRVYTSGYFYTEVKPHTETDKEYCFNFICSIKKNQDIDNLIKSGLCRFCCLVECQATKLRQDYYDSNDNIGVIDIRIPVSDLCGKVEFSVSLVAVSEIKNFTSELFCKEFKGMSFNYAPGDYIAIGIQTDIVLPRLSDSQYVDNESILVIERAESKDSMKVYLSDPKKIKIRLNQDHYKTYARFKKDKSLKSLLSQMIALPAIAEVLAEIRASGDTYSNRIWYSKLNEILKKVNNGNGFEKIFNPEEECFDEFTALDLAQKILKNPLTSAFAALSDLYHKDDEEAFNE